MRPKKPAAQFVNCIGHAISIEMPDGSLLTLSAARKPATVRQTVVGAFAQVPIIDTWGEIENLPEPSLNTVHIVSRTVRQALDQRGETRIDVLVPAEMIYEVVNGRREVKACRALSR